MFLKYKKGKRINTHTNTHTHACRLHPSFGAPFMRIEDHKKKYSKNKKKQNLICMYTHLEGSWIESAFISKT